MNIERTWWFKGGVGVLTVLSAVALFYFAGRWPVGPSSISGWLVFFFCLVGLQRAYAGLFGVVSIIFMPVSPGGEKTR
jgi:hypothetical protein